MPATVAHLGRRRHPHPRRLPKLRDIAAELECSEAVAEKKLYGPHAVNIETAKIVAVLVRRGETDHAAMFEAPISAVMMGEAIPAWQEAIHTHNLCDAKEDIAQSEWIHNTSDENLENYIKSLASDILNAERLMASLIRERDQRQAEK